MGVYFVIHFRAGRVARSRRVGTSGGARSGLAAVLVAAAVTLVDLVQAQFRGRLPHSHLNRHFETLELTSIIDNENTPNCHSYARVTGYFLVTSSDPLAYAHNRSTS